MPNDAATMNPVERLLAVENTFATGDSYAAQNLLTSVNNQQIFMDRLGSRAQADNLPGLQITFDKDNDHVLQIKTDKLTITEADGQLSAHANHWKDAISSGVNDTWNSAQAMWKANDPSKSALADCLATSGTTSSCENRRIDKQLKDAGAD